MRRIGGALAVAGIALALVCALGSSLIVPLVYGTPYLYTAPTFAILSLALPLFFLNYALTHQVIGWDGQRAYLLIAALALVANVAANVALVPSQGMIGAAIATLVTEVVVTAGCRLRARRTARRSVSAQPLARRRMIPTREQELAVLRSVVYASLFDYPLEPAQLEASLIGVGADAATIERWWRESDLLQAAIEYRDGLLFPCGALRSRAHPVAPRSR